MRPSTGPKYSTWWNSLPGRTPARMPGRHSRSDNWRGFSNHDSPGPSSVRPRSSFSPGRSVRGPSSADGSLGHATVSDAAASISWSRNRRDFATEPTRMPSEAAEHFCPACPKALATRSAAARSRSAEGITTMAFLPEVSASSGRSGRQERNISAVSAAPVSTTCSMRASVTSERPSGPSSTTTSWATSRGMPARQQASASSAAIRRAGGAGFRMTADPAASAAATPPSGIAIGKFHGEATSVRRGGTCVAPSTFSSARPA